MSSISVMTVSLLSIFGSKSLGFVEFTSLICFLKWLRLAAYFIVCVTDLDLGLLNILLKKSNAKFCFGRWMSDLSIIN